MYSSLIISISAAIAAATDAALSQTFHRFEALGLRYHPLFSAMHFGSPIGYEYSYSYKREVDPSQHSAVAT